MIWRSSAGRSPGLRAVKNWPSWTTGSSILAARFKQTVGHGPLEYLTRWRIEISANRLASTD